MSETPKLFTRKPKKAQIKQFQGNAAKDFSPPASVPPTPPTPPAPAPAAAAPVKESFARRYKFLWPLLLTVNLTVGAYIFMRTKKKDTSGEGETAIHVAAAATDSGPTAANDSVPTAAPVAENVKSAVTSSHSVLPNVSAVAVQTTVSPMPTTPQSTTAIVSDEQQRELFKWILDEKRRINPIDTEEKKRIDAEKAVLKQYIRAKSVPTV